MIYSQANVDRAAVYDVDTKEQFRKVLAVNAAAGWILVADEPVRANKHGHVVSRRIRFNAIHPIFGGGVAPCMFHCYGRQ